MRSAPGVLPLTLEITKSNYIELMSCSMYLAEAESFKGWCCLVKKACLSEENLLGNGERICYINR